MCNVNELTFGVEIETHVPAGRVPVGAYHRGTACPGLPGWKTMADASIGPPVGRKGCEFVSPILRGTTGLADLLHAVKTIRERFGAKINSSCGLHIHVGFTGNPKTLKRLITLVANFEKAMFASAGTPNRELGHWCGSLQRHGSTDRAEQESSRFRYHVLNLTNLTNGRRQTVEFRAFSGTTDATKIIGYVRMCLGLVERAWRTSRKTNFTAKPTKSTSPIARKGAGQTALARLYYQLGWIKGRVPHTHGMVDCEGAPDLKACKKELMRLAKQYDQKVAERQETIGLGSRSDMRR